MANSKFRATVKPFLFKVSPKKMYLWLQYKAKIRDIKKKLVEEKEMILLPLLIKPGDEVLDIGANYAYYTERLSKLVKNGKVFAFEPIPTTYEISKKIIKYFNIKNVELYQKAVGAKNETVNFKVPLTDFGFISAEQAHLGFRNNNLKGKEEIHNFKNHQDVLCEMIRLDDFLYKKLSNLTFVKIDIEGAEYFALKGMQKIIKKFNPIILLEIIPFFLKGFGIKQKDFLNLIKKMDYGLFFFDKNSSKLLKFKSKLVKNNYLLMPRKQKLNKTFFKYS